MTPRERWNAADKPIGHNPIGFEEGRGAVALEVPRYPWTFHIDSVPAKNILVALRRVSGFPNGVCPDHNLAELLFDLVPVNGGQAAIIGIHRQ